MGDLQPDHRSFYMLPFFKYVMHSFNEHNHVGSWKDFLEEKKKIQLKLRSHRIVSEIWPILVYLGSDDVTHALEFANRCPCVMREKSVWDSLKLLHKRKS